jgi:amino acid adenylation domain-containing protein
MNAREFSGKMALAASRYGKEKNYWLNKLSGELVKSSFPYDHGKTAADRNETDKTHKFEVIHINPNGKLVERIMKIGKNSDYTLHMILAAALVALLGKYTGSKDIIIGMPIYRKDIEGEFLNTALALRHRLTGNMSFRELLIQVRQTIVEADKHQNYPIETLLYHLNMTFSGNDFPLFDVVVLLENIHQKRDIEPTHPNVIFSFLSAGSCIEGNVEYNSFLYRKETMERILTHFTRLLEEAVFNTEMPVLAIDILSREEKEKLLYDFNRTQTEYPGDKTIDKLFEDQAARTPCKAAVIDEEGCLTYEMVNERARGLAVYLQGKGLMKEEAVGIMAENSVGMIIGILGILKGGGIYLPLNSEYPGERRRYLLKDGNVSKLLANAQDGGESNDYEGVDVIRIDDPGIYSAACSPGRDHSFNSLAYIMYTSGSTGNPKGVMIEHRSVVRLVKNTDYVEFREEDRILQTGALDFDASTFEIWGALLNGLQLYLAGKEKILTPDTLKSLIWGKSITTIWMTSPLFNQMVDADIEIFKGLRNLLVGGDVLSPPHINRVRVAFPGLKVINGYGPTENTTFSVTHLIEREYKQGIPIGKPISNSRVYIIDRQGQPVPIGVVGELCVGGDGLARGYLNNPELTAEKFIEYRSYRTYRTYSSSKKIYKTGDLARWLPDGSIDFLGRIDHQVKIRGYRIEPGEIENQLTRLDSIDEVVLVDRQVGGEKCLCAYIVCQGSGELDIVEVKHSLSKNLPGYMIPSYFIRVDKIPLGPTGKVDRKALPEPAIKAGGNYVAPRDDREKRMVDIWSEVLGVEKEIIGIDTDFFELGGHSLKATFLTARLHKEFNVKVPLAEIFKTPSIRELYGYIKGAAEHRHISIENVEKREYYELSAAQKRLYIIEQMGEPSTNYNVSIPLVLEGDLNRSKLEETFPHLITRHESLRTSFHIKGKNPVQKIHDRVEFSIRYYEVAAGKRNVETVIQDFIQPFDLSRAPLFKVGLIKLEENEHLLMVDFHHIITDGISLQIMVEEVMALYREEDLPEIRLQYKDFSVWQNKLLLSEEIKRQEEYWLKLYEGDILQLDLPVNFERPVNHDFAGANVPFELSAAETAALNRLALNEEVTLYMLLLSLYNVFLAKLSSQEDILVGTSTAGRRHADLEPVFGMFVNTLCLRNHSRGERSFGEFLHEVKQRTVEAFENQDYQFEDLVEKLPLKRFPGGNPLFNVSFSFHNEMESAGISEIDIGGLKLKPYDSEVTTSHFDLTLRGVEIDEKLFFSFHYRTALFEKETMEWFTTYFKRIVTSIIENPGQRIYDILPPDENIKLLKRIDREVYINRAVVERQGREHSIPTPPGDEIERTLVKIWSDVLEIDEAAIGVNDFFTDLDGQSLKAIMLASWIHKEFNVSIPIHAIFELSTIKMLAEYIKKSVEDKCHTIKPAEQKEYYALSPGQERLYIIWQMELESISYNVSQMVTLEGKLDIEKLADAFNKLINRHESLRTTFEMVGEEPVQRIHKNIDFSMEYYEPGEGGSLAMPHASAVVNGIIKKFIRPFDLGKAPLLRVGLIEISERKCVLMSDRHHIISDAASRRIFLEDFLDLYEGKELPDLRLQYKDYSEWVNSPAQGEAVKRQEVYWLEQFEGELPVLNLPVDFPRPPVQSFEGGIVELGIGKVETTALQKLAVYENATMFMVLLAVFNVFLAKISGQEDIIVGSAVVGRRHADLEKIIGIFINTLALRNYPKGEKTFREFLSDLRKRSFNAFENQQYQFDDLVDRLSIKRDVSRNPLFDVYFSYQEAERYVAEISRMDVAISGQELVQHEHLVSRFDLSLSVVVGETSDFAFEYCTKLFKRETIEKMGRRFIEILKKVAENIDIRLQDIAGDHELLVPEEETFQDEEAEWNL